jgi:uncharacterized protein (TIGR04255 family)
MSAAMPESSGARFTLERPPIELAVAEIRYRGDVNLIPQATGLAFREALRGCGLDMDGFDPVATQEVNFEMTSTGGHAVARTADQGWVCRDSATGLVVTLMPSSLAVQTRVYKRWSETLEPPLRSALEALTGMLAPTLRTRIGLRYVNRFVDYAAATPGAWAARFDQGLLGPLVAGPLVRGIRGSQQQLELGWADGLAGVVRHGAFLDAAANHSFSYLLDIDIFDAATEAFDAADLAERMTALNRKSAELFRSLLSEAHLDERGLAEDATAGESS